MLRDGMFRRPSSGLLFGQTPTVGAWILTKTVVPYSNIAIVCYMGGCQNYGPLLGPLNNMCRIILRTHQGTIILTTTHTK